ncbi:MAG: SMI1/KNR4 family protein [Daejeonella sp.]
MIEESWNKFVNHLKVEDTENLEKINPPATIEQLEKAKAVLGPLFHEDLQKIYKLANGFIQGAYILSDGYRILPIDEMLEKSLDLVGQVLITDVEAGEFKKIDKIKMVIFAIAKEDDEDIEQIGFSLRRNKTDIAIWYKEGGIHSFEEVVETGETFEEWFNDMLEYY